MADEAINARKLVTEAKRIGRQQIDAEIMALIEFLLTQPRRNVLEIDSAEGGTFYLWCRLFSGKKLSLDKPCGPLVKIHASRGPVSR